uniref:SBSPO protein n=1 Tax=Zonotrichia albicollis TaxID=44394 RepID=A0A8D2N5P9_ZONAL
NGSWRDLQKDVLSYVQKCYFCSRHVTGMTPVTFHISVAFPPAIPCVVSQWSAWSGCAEPCKTTYRVRTRHIIQEPRNGGESCPALEERAGCMEYWSRQGTECQQSLSKSMEKCLDSPGEDSGLGQYCVQFRLVSLAPGCRHGQRWMSGLREGLRLCVECQPPALHRPGQPCRGDGAASPQNQLLHWQAVGNHRCKGTWRRIRRLDTCSCPSVHSFLFI